MKKTILFLLVTILFLTGCRKGEERTCSDGIRNQGEQNIDCGGPCTACMNCADGKQNQDETGIDCGGTCTMVCPTCSDGKKNQGETAIDCGGPCGVCPLTWTTNLSGTLMYADSAEYIISAKKLRVSVVKYQKFDMLTIVFNPTTTIGVGTFPASVMIDSLSSYWNDISWYSSFWIVPYRITDGSVTISSVTSNKMNGTFSLIIQNNDTIINFAPGLDRLTGNINNVIMR